MSKEQVFYDQAGKNMARIDELILEVRKLADEDYIIARLKQINQIEYNKQEENHLECSNCEESWSSCGYYLSEIGKSCCRECWHELYVPPTDNKKEDYGLPPTDESVGIRPTIL